jgi:hypothetical protein
MAKRRIWPLKHEGYAAEPFPALVGDDAVVTLSRALRRSSYTADIFDDTFRGWLIVMQLLPVELEQASIVDGLTPVRLP